ncbi:hypothetical protein Vadar_024775 [Vaccinium darrowii]|uniref:Uncharacterized protein n=1 Tax=Vaccinium darrowii TaxID=229202 RepID=A0ACB7XJQ5_9ERIC|nr:hypothetical protein Vadar_024775 [Vaccinium darrowii]
MDESGELKLQYGHRCGRCKLQIVEVLNEGIDWTSGQNASWQHDVQPFELLKVVLHGNAVFEAADDVFLVGSTSTNYRALVVYRAGERNMNRR